MKKLILLFLTTFIIGLHPVFAGDADNGGKNEVENTENMAEEVEEATVPDFIPLSTELFNRPTYVFSEGFSFAQIRRYVSQKEQNRSDFRWCDSLIGAYFQVETKNIKPLNFFGRVSVFYPFAHQFNEMKQTSKQILLYSFDFFGGALFEINSLKYIRFNFGLGPHFNYELSDEYHHIELGGMALAGIELPIAWRWTILIDFLGSIDYGNLGTNKIVCPYNFVWQYQTSIGIRYSIDNTNKYSYIPSSGRVLTESGIYDKKQRKALEKAADAKRKRIAKENAKSKLRAEKEREEAERDKKLAELQEQKRQNIIEKRRQKLEKQAERMDQKARKAQGLEVIEEVPEA